MLTSRSPIGSRSRRLSDTVLHSYRERSAAQRARREHDDAIASDHRFAIEHRIQVNRSVDLGRGGCPYCE